MFFTSAASSQRFRAGGIRGYGGAMRRPRQAPARGGALRYHGLMHLFFLSALEHGGASRGFPAPSAINFGVQGHTGTPAFPVPVGNTGTEKPKPLNQRLIFFPVPFW